MNPFRDWAKVTDCGDIANTPFDKLVAIHELEKGMKAINSLKPKNESAANAVRLITIGGDHTISNINFPLSFLNTDQSSFAYPQSSTFDMGSCRSSTFRQSS